MAPVSGDRPRRRRPNDDGRLALEIAFATLASTIGNFTQICGLVFSHTPLPLPPAKSAPPGSTSPALSRDKRARFAPPAETRARSQLPPEAHRRIILVPIALDAEANEFLALERDPFIGIGAAGAAKLHRRHVLLLAPVCGNPPRPSTRSAGRDSPSPARNRSRSPSSAWCGRRCLSGSCFRRGRYGWARWRRAGRRAARISAARPRPGAKAGRADLAPVGHALGFLLRQPCAHGKGIARQFGQKQCLAIVAAGICGIGHQPKSPLERIRFRDTVPVPRRQSSTRAGPQIREAAIGKRKSAGMRSAPSRPWPRRHIHCSVEATGLNRPAFGQKSHSEP